MNLREWSLQCGTGDLMALVYGLMKVEQLHKVITDE